MFAGNARAGDQLWDPHDQNGAPIPFDPLNPGGSDLVYTVRAVMQQGSNIVLMVQEAIDGGTTGRVFEFDQAVPLFRPPRSDTPPLDQPGDDSPTWRIPPGYNAPV